MKKKPLARDSKDESKINKTETLALKRKRSSSRGSGVAMSSFPRNDVGFYTGAKLSSTNDFRFHPVSAFPEGSSFVAHSTAPVPEATCNSTSLDFRGLFRLYNHFRKNCPDINRSSVPARNQSSSGK